MGLWVVFFAGVPTSGTLEAEAEEDFASATRRKYKLQIHQSGRNPHNRTNIRTRQRRRHEPISIPLFSITIPSTLTNIPPTKPQRA